MSLISRLIIVASAAALSACGTVYKPAGWFVYDYTQDYAVPYTMKTTDLDMACSMTGAMLPVMMSFTELRSAPNRNAVVMNTLMGNCAEVDAAEETLTYNRAIKDHEINTAKDARIREKRGYAVAAARQYTAYQAMVAEFGEPGEKCPKLKAKDEIYWVLGNLSGLQAVLSDLRAQAEVGVPKDIAMKSVRGMQCVDNNKWWGLPHTLEAGLWALMPDSTPEGIDPWQKMAEAQETAINSGVRLAHAVAVIIADSTGHNEQLRAAVRSLGSSLKTQSSDTKYALIDTLGIRHVQSVSDRLWIEGTGARTPVGSLGTFWDDVVENPANNIDIDDLLGD